jgi:hypothetical protein
MSRMSRSPNAGPELMGPFVVVTDAIFRALANKESLELWHSRRPLIFSDEPRTPQRSHATPLQNLKPAIEAPQSIPQWIWMIHVRW